jgi:hypothetical protein
LAFVVSGIVWLATGQTTVPVRWIALMVIGVLAIWWAVWLYRIEQRMQVSLDE